MVTIREVASSANVSIKTVSRVLNNEPGVSEATRLCVEAAIERLHYVPNESARRLKSGRSEIFALILPRVESPYASKLLSSLLAEASDRRYAILVLEDKLTSPGGLAFIQHALLYRRVDGVLIAPPGGDDPALLNFINDHHLPVVLISPRHLTDHQTVVEATDYDGAAAATRYLVGLGHRRIAHLMSLKTERFTHERLRGYLAALEKAGLLPDHALIGQGDNSVASGLSEARRLLDLPDPPTAFFAANDEMAVGVMIAAWQCGLRVPQDISVVGFDDAPIAQQVFPALTTVAQPISSIARLAVEALIALIDDPFKPGNQLRVSTRLVVRQSCAPPGALKG
jgi:LacI family transcriptional regulator